MGTTSANGGPDTCVSVACSGAGLATQTAIDLMCAQCPGGGNSPPAGGGNSPPAGAGSGTGNSGAGTTGTTSGACATSLLLSVLAVSLATFFQGSLATMSL